MEINNNVNKEARGASRNLKKTKSEANFLSARSREREQGKAIEDILYEDAKRRWDTHEIKKRALQKLKDE